MDTWVACAITCAVVLLTSLRDVITTFRLIHNYNPNYNCADYVYLCVPIISYVTIIVRRYRKPDSGYNIIMVFGDDEVEDFPEIVKREAITLSQDDLHAELLLYGIHATGVAATNVATLQDKFDQEYKRHELKRQEFLERKRKREASRKKRQEFEKQHAEEMAALAEDPKTEFWYKLAHDNQTPDHASLRGLNHITARAVSRVMKANHSITSLDLSRNDLGDEAGIHIANIIKFNPQLVKLELERAGLGSVTCRALASKLLHNSTLAHLSLEGNPLMLLPNGDTDASGIEALAGSVRTNTSLRTLNLFNTGLGLEAGRALEAALTDNHTLLCLDVNNNSVGLKELDAIRTKLDQNIQQNDDRESQLRKLRQSLRTNAQDRSDSREKERRRLEQQLWHEEQARFRAENRAQKYADEKAKKRADEDREKLMVEKMQDDPRKSADGEKKKDKKKGKKK